MRYNPDIHHRRSIRLKGYDYSQAGMYFVTICVNVGADLRVCPNKGEQRGEHTGSPVQPVPPVRPNLFGNVVNGEMVLNDAGQMVTKWCLELSNKFSDIELDTYIIMPNHIHAIIVNNGNPVGANLCVRPNNAQNIHICPDKTEHTHILGEHGTHILGEHVGSPLHAVVQWFKTMTTNEYIRGVKTLGWQRFNKKLWQRNYWEHIIRNNHSYQSIVNYIINNPMNWTKDKFYTE